MSWADKQLKKHKLRKQIKEIMDSPELSNVTETHIWNRMNSVRRNGRRNSKWDAEENVR